MFLKDNNDQGGFVRRIHVRKSTTSVMSGSRPPLSRVYQARVSRVVNLRQHLSTTAIESGSPLSERGEGVENDGIIIGPGWRVKISGGVSRVQTPLIYTYAIWARGLLHGRSLDFGGKKCGGIPRLCG